MTARKKRPSSKLVRALDAPRDRTRRSVVEQLREANEQFGRSRNRQPKARHPEDQVEAYYRRQLSDLIKAARQRIMKQVVPVLREEQASFEDSGLTQDERAVHDAWADRVIEALEAAVASVMANAAFQTQFRRLAEGIVRRADGASTEAVIKSVNESIGVDLRSTLEQQDMQDFLAVARKQNVELIKSVPQGYFDRVENVIMSGVRDGHSVSFMMRQLREAGTTTESQARRIARDQSAKLTSQITERRQKGAGINYYRVVTANDERVTGRPGGKYPNAKISCWGIAKRDIGYGPGVYRWDEGASWGGFTGLHPGRHHIQCRCAAVPVFDWEVEGDE